MNKLASALFFSLLAAATMTAQTAAPANPISAGTKAIYNIVKTNVTKAAEKMPEANYSFKPTPEVRSFGQLIGHVADAQYIFCSMATGKPNNGPGVEKNKHTKADLAAALQAAFSYCDEIYNGMTDTSAPEIIKFLGRDAPRIMALDFNNAHMDEHYGNIVTYMRLKGLVPPSSETEEGRR
ncbi:MAG: DinB family protein [Acidobacteriia bacterium]|nr:DinB family protein [Terriglobia bacterium]